MTMLPSSRAGGTYLSLKYVTSRLAVNEWHRRDFQAIGFRCLPGLSRSTEPGHDSRFISEIA